MNTKKDRITIILSSDVIKKVRVIQANRLKKSTKSVSFSQIVEELAKIGLKNFKDKSLKLIIQAGSLAALGVGVCIEHGIEHSFHEIEIII